MIYKCPTPIAILLAVYNGEKFLREQIDSIIAQTNQEWMLYIRDDASVDLTRQIIADYCTRYSNIVAIEDGLGNLGYNGNFTRLLELVDAEYYMFCDADDYWMPEKIQISYDFLREKEEQNLNIPILIHCNFVDADENLIIDPIDKRRKLKRYNPDYISKFRHIPLYIVGGSVSIFNHLGKKHYLEPNVLSVNYDNWLGLQIARYGKLFYNPQIMKIYRRHGKAATGNNLSHQTPQYIIKKIISPIKTFKYHWDLASKMQQLEYGSKFKYFYYRMIVFCKIKYVEFFYQK